LLVVIEGTLLPALAVCAGALDPAEGEALLLLLLRPVLNGLVVEAVLLFPPL